MKEVSRFRKKESCMGRVFLCAVLLFTSRLIPAFAQEDTAQEVTPAELAAFGVTLYGEGELFPLEGLLTVDHVQYDRAPLAGKYVLLNLFATWCPYCAKEKPSVQGLYERYESGRFTVLCVSLGEGAETVREYMREQGYTFPVAIEPSNTLRESHAPRLPTTYILDGRGYITARINGNKDGGTGEAQRILRYLAPVI